MEMPLFALIHTYLPRQSLIGTLYMHKLDLKSEEDALDALHGHATKNASISSRRSVATSFQANAPHGAEQGSLYATTHRTVPHAPEAVLDTGVGTGTTVGASTGKDTVAPRDVVPETRHREVWRDLDTAALLPPEARTNTALRRAARHAYAHPRAVSKDTLLRVPTEHRLFAQPISLAATEPHNEDTPVQAGIGDTLHEWILAYEDNDAVMQRLFHNEAVQYAQERGLLRGRWRNNERGRGLLPRLKEEWWGRAAKDGKGGKYTWGSAWDSVASVRRTTAQTHHLRRVYEEQQRLLRDTVAANTTAAAHAHSPRSVSAPASSRGNGGLGHRDATWMRAIASHITDNDYTYADDLSRPIDEIYEGDDNLYEGHRSEDLKPRVPELLVPLSAHRRVVGTEPPPDHVAHPFTGAEGDGVLDMDTRKSHFSGYLVVGSNAVVPMAAFEPRAVHTRQARAAHPIPSTLREKVPDLLRTWERMKDRPVYSDDAILPYAFEHSRSYRDALMSEVEGTSIPSGGAEEAVMVNTATEPAMHVGAPAHYGDSREIEQLEMPSPHIPPLTRATHGRATTPMDLDIEFFEDISLSDTESSDEGSGEDSHEQSESDDKRQVEDKKLGTQQEKAADDLSVEAKEEAQRGVGRRGRIV